MPGQKFDLVVVANRLPVVRVPDAGGGKSWRPSPGGLVSAVEPAMRTRDAAWVGWAGETGPPPAPFRLDRLWLRPVGLSAREVQDHYEGMCNATLWPLFHDLAVPVSFHRRWWQAYQGVNERFARAVAGVAAPGAIVWVHDYQLQLVPGMVRALRPDLRIGWFDHIPFPPVELFAQLPWRAALLEGLLAADFLGFQRDADAENFLRVCRRLLDLVPQEDSVTVESPPGAGGPRTVRVAAVPISVDFEALDAVARTPEVAAAAAELRASLGNPATLLLGVDRLDYTKGIRHRLRAYEELLQDRVLGPPGVTLLEAGLPSREAIDTYQELRREIQATVARINDRYSVTGSAAVHLVERRCPPADLAAMFLAADVMLVTPLRDGMNLVAKEYVACRHDLGGALVLSEFAGAWHELRESFACNPHDIDGMKRAVLDAIGATEHERRRRMQALRSQVAGHDVQRWAARNLEALTAAPYAPTHRGPDVAASPLPSPEATTPHA